MFEDISRAKEKVGRYVQQRLESFKELGSTGKTHYDFSPFLEVEFDADLFSELAFCILTANSSARLGIRIQKLMMENPQLLDDVEALEKAIASMGHRFARQRAERIVKARQNFERTLSLIRSTKNSKEIRDLLSNANSRYKVEGFGLKEASHFLRNIGYEDVAIIDRHIFRFLMEKRLIPEYKTITRNLYFTAEKVLESIARDMKLSLAELDLYIFYIKTGKVLK
ncbi:N-glycosylase/DNA lyase [Thermocrinis minervae]|uniref:8-oxoguanine DNA glycosylase/AP lyase n=1 Tax=Thermocrinis minervae TaxID=381751 RepID=A0A1M6R930_9AQUI|nr:N-glycosylase/DNA lyase [Thermocrinis minervae]SHK28926.1 N-glycosylase/DNA lyase [Thermocrinis minervae]